MRIPSNQPTPKPPTTYRANVEPISLLVISDDPEERASRQPQKAMAGAFNRTPISTSRSALKFRNDRTIATKIIAKKLKGLKTQIKKN
jgi:hypothetical protein